MKTRIQHRPDRGGIRHTRSSVVTILSFAIPLLLLLVAYMVMKFWPVGDRSPLTIDLYHQYASFITELRRKLLEGESLFYSWSVGLGTNFYALYAYYAASPLNLLLVFFPKQHITEAVTFLIVTKIGLAGLTFSTLLQFGLARDKHLSFRAQASKHGLNGEQIGTDAVIVALSTAYALCAFNLAYSWDIMWLDVIVLLPLVILGVRRLIRDKTYLLYALSLGASLFVNYYVAFFVCIFTALYFGVDYFTARAEEEERWQTEDEANAGLALQNSVGDLDELMLSSAVSATRAKALDVSEASGVKGQVKTAAEALRRPTRRTAIPLWSTVLRFALITLIGAGLSAILLLPIAISLRETSAAGDVFPSTLNLKFSLFDFITYQLMNIPPTIRDGLPNVYCGLLSLIFLPLYVLAKSIKLKEKLPNLILLAFLFISFNLNALDFIWHGFHYPNQLPFRYSFLFSFLLLLIVFRTLTVLYEFSARLLMGTAAVGIAFVIIAEEINTDLLDHGHAYLNIFFLFIYLMLLAYIWKPNYFRTVALLLAVVMVSELAVNTMVTVATIGKKEVYTARSAFVDDMPQVEALIKEVKAREDKNFYRMEILPAKTTNDGALYGYNGFTLFSSTSREDTAKLMRRLAYHGNNINSYKYVASTPVGNSLFGLKYLLLKNGASRDIGLSQIAAEGEMTLLENPNVINIGVAGSASLINWSPVDSSPFAVWNDLLSSMANLQPVFTPVSLTVESGANFHPSTGDAVNGLHFNPEDMGKSSLMNLSYEVPEDQYVYFAVDTGKDTTVTVSIDGTNARANDSMKPEETVTLSDSRTIHWMETFDAGYCLAGDKINIKLEQKSDKANNFTIYAVAMNKANYEAAMAKLKERELKVTEAAATRIKATYSTPEDGLIYLSIPYDKSWTAKIDGQSVETESIANKALLAVQTKAGQHEIELNFVPNGFTGGALITAFSALLLVGLWFLAPVMQKLSLKMKPRPDEETAEEAGDGGAGDGPDSGVRLRILNALPVETDEMAVTAAPDVLEEGLKSASALPESQADKRSSETAAVPVSADSGEMENKNQSEE